MINIGISNLLKASAFTLSAMVCSLYGQAPYSTPTTFKNAAESASPGDVIILADGTYDFTGIGTVVIPTVASAALPVVIRAETIGGVIIEGTGGIKINGTSSNPAAYVTVQGFHFKNEPPVNAALNGMELYSTNCVFTQNTFEQEGATSSKHLFVKGDYHDISYNEFIDINSGAGRVIEVVPGSTGIQIRYNHFRNITVGSETIKFGNGNDAAVSPNVGFGVIEYNLFENIDTDPETISVKSSNNIIRYNTFNNTRALVLRHGNDNKVYGNYMRDSEGVRFHGDRHLIYSNYFRGNTGVVAGRGTAQFGGQGSGNNYSLHDSPEDCYVVHNTFFFCSDTYRAESSSLGQDNITFAHNVIRGGDAALTVDTATYVNGVWDRNVLRQNGNGVPGIGPGVPTSGFDVGSISVDPVIRPDGDDIYRLRDSSRPVAGFTGVVPMLDFSSFVDVDMDGQPRTGNPDVGADEYYGGAEPVNAKRLTASDVGPDAAPASAPPLLLIDLELTWTLDGDGWQTATIPAGFTNPIVVASPVSYNGSGPCHVRVRNVTSTGFEWRVQEWEYQDGIHGADETVHFLIMEEGVHTFGGKPWVAGSFTDATGAWKTVSYTGHTFGGGQTVLAQVVTDNDTTAVVIRMRNVTGSSFEMKLKEEEGSSNPSHGAETIHYISVGGGTGTESGVSYQSGKTGSTVTDVWKTVNFGSTYTDPAFFAQIRTNNGAEPCELRYDNLTNSSVRFFIEEEKSFDSEVSHPNGEVVNWLVIGD